MVLPFGASYEPLACPRNKVGPISGPISGPIAGPIGDGGVGPIGVEIRGDMGWLLSMVLIFGASYEPLGCPRNKVGPISGPISGPIANPIAGPIAGLNGVGMRLDMGWLLSMVLIFRASYEPLGFPIAGWAP